MEGQIFILLLIVINSIMGTGIYFLPAIGAKYAGPMSIISWVIMSLIAVYISMCFAELVSMFPKAGGVYEYSKQAYGRFTSFLVGWITFIAANVTIAIVFVKPNGTTAIGIKRTGIIARAIPTAHTVPDSRVSDDFCSIINIISNVSHAGNTYYNSTFEKSATRFSRG